MEVDDRQMWGFKLDPSKMLNPNPLSFRDNERGGETHGLFYL